MKINLNDKVKVKLTPIGVEIYYNQNDALIESLQGKVREEDLDKMKHMPQIDRDGYTQFQLWKLFKLYGEHIGITKKLPFEPNIEIID